MKNTMGIILTGGRKPALKELSAIRSASAIPVGGKYRAIDFTLSNMVNSGIKNVGVITQFSFRSLIDHLGSGKEWDLDRKQDGLFVFPPSMDNDDSGWYKGSADAIFSNITFLKRSNEDYVIIANGDCVYKMDYKNLLEFHLEKKADITISYRIMDDFEEEELKGLGIITLDKNSRVVDFQEKPRDISSNIGSMGIYIISRKLLISLIQECAAHGDYDFVKDIIIKKLNNMGIYGYLYKGYWRNLGTINSFYRCNMEMLNPELIHNMFTNNGRIYTKVKDEAPAKYNEEAEVTNSIIADGCIIEGTIADSVLFRGVTVKKGAVIKGSIIMQNATIEEGVVLENAILDKNVVITCNKRLRGEQALPIIVGKDLKV